MSYENIILESKTTWQYSLLTPKALNALNKDTLSEMRNGPEDINRPGHKSGHCNRQRYKVLWLGLISLYALSASEGREFSDYGEKTMRMIELIEKPFIAAIKGFALGGGCELAMACDIRLAAENAVFAQPEVGLGVIPGFGGTQRLPRLIGEGRAKELTYTADTINAAEAYRIGLVNHIYPVDELMEPKNAARIASKGTLAVGFSKYAIGKGLQADIDTAMGIESDMFGMCCSTADQKEGMGAFLEKRKPVFKGK